MPRRSMSCTAAARGGSGEFRQCAMSASIWPRRRSTVATNRRAKARSRGARLPMLELSSMASSSGRLRRSTAPTRSTATARAEGRSVPVGADSTTAAHQCSLRPAATPAAALVSNPQPKQPGTRRDRLQASPLGGGLAGPCRTGPIEGCRNRRRCRNPGPSLRQQYRPTRRSPLINRIKSRRKSAAPRGPSPRAMAIGSAKAAAPISDPPIRNYS